MAGDKKSMNDDEKGKGGTIRPGMDVVQVKMIDTRTMGNVESSDYVASKQAALQTPNVGDTNDGDRTKENTGALSSNEKDDEAVRGDGKEKSAETKADAGDSMKENAESKPVETAPKQDNNAESDQIRIFDIDPLDDGLKKSVFIDDKLPLLDLDELWKEVFDATDASEAERSAKKLTDELKQYFWNQVLSEERKENLKKKEVVDMFGATVDERIAYAKKYQDKEEEEPEVLDLNSVFGEALLFKLRCDNKSLKKDTPKMTPEEDLEFMRKILTKLRDCQKESKHFYTIVSTIGFYLIDHFYAKLVGASEERKTELGKVVKDLMLFCANFANPLEMELQLRVAISNISRTHYEGTVFHSLCDLVEIWGIIISRLRHNRASCVQKFLQTLERMLLCGQSHRTTYYFDEGHDFGGFDERIDDELIAVYCRLIETQEKQWKENKTMQSITNINGCLKQTRVICQFKQGQKKSFRERSENDLRKPTNDDPVRPDDEQVVDDWLLERQCVLVSVLNTLKEVVYKLTVPQHDEAAKVRELRSRHVNRMEKLVEIVKRLGWNNTLRGIQLSTTNLCNENIHPDGTTFEQGLGPILKFTEGSKHTALSLIAVSCYFYAAMRKPGCNANSLFEFTLDGTGFELLDEKQALYEAMPFTMSLLSLTPKVPSLAGAHLSRLFTDRFEFVCDAEDVLLWRFGLNQSGRHITIEGLAMHICRLVERVDDQNRDTREFVYQTFKSILKTIGSPAIRFSLVYELIAETGRIAVAAQLISELKDVLAYGDVMVSEGKWSMESNDELKTRFVEALMPKYMIPRKDSLAVLSPIVSLSSASFFLASRDMKREKCEAVEERKKFMLEHLKVAKEVVRALCACAEHDIRSIPEKLMKKNVQKRNHVEAATQSLNEGIGCVETIERTISILKGE